MKCRYCDSPRPRGYATTCGDSHCQQRDYEEHASRTKRRKRKAKR